MALVTCPECGKEISDQVPTCIHCGFRNPNAPKNDPIKEFLATVEGKVAAGAAVVLLVAALAGLAHAAAPNMQATTQDPSPAAQESPAANEAAANTAQDSQQQSSDDKPLSIVNVGYKILSKDGDFWNISYKVDVMNKSGDDITAGFKVEYKDKDGYTVDTDYENNKVFKAGGVTSVSGTSMVQSNIAIKIKSISIE